MGSGYREHMATTIAELARLPATQLDQMVHSITPTQWLNTFARADLEAVRDLAMQLAETKEGRDLAVQLAGSIGSWHFAVWFTGTKSSSILATSLAATGEGRDLAVQLAGTREGRDLAVRLFLSEAGRSLAMELAGTREGRALTLQLTETTGGRRLAVELGENMGGWGLSARASLSVVAGLVAIVVTIVVILLADGATEGVGPSVEAVATLTGPHIAESKRLLEPVLGQLQLLADDSDSVLSEVDEMYLRAQIETIGAQHRTLDELDATIVTRSIGNIVTRLLQCHSFGPRARALLEELGTEPPEIVEQVIGGINASLEEITKLALSTVDANDDAVAAAVPIVDAARASEEVEVVLAEIPDARRKIARRAGRIGEKMIDGAAEHSGQVILTTAVGAAVAKAPTLLGLLAAAIAQASGLGIDAVFAALVEMAPQLRDLYTNYRAAWVVGDGQSDD